MVKAATLVDRIRKICLALPEVTERLSHGAPTFFVKNKTFMTVWANGHHDHTMRPSLRIFGCYAVKDPQRRRGGSGPPWRVGHATRRERAGQALYI